LDRLNVTERVIKNTSARTSAFPPVKPGDMIIEEGNIRWEVEKRTATTLKGAAVHQELTLHEIPRGDIRYSVPVSVDPREEFVAECEYTHPQDFGREQEQFATWLLEDV